MPILEVRRHAPTKKGETRGHGSHLSQEGVRVARKIGGQIGPFARVITSEIPRTLETALAMGFAVDEVVAELGQMSELFWQEIGRHDHWSWSRPFERYRQLIDADNYVASVGRAQAAIWRKTLEAVADQEAVLVISHGHAIEAGLATCFTQGELDELAQPFGHCEGFRAAYQNGAFTQLTVLRCTEFADPELRVSMMSEY